MILGLGHRKYMVNLKHTLKSGNEVILGLWLSGRVLA